MKKRYLLQIFFFILLLSNNLHALAPYQFHYVGIQTVKRCFILIKSTLSQTAELFSHLKLKNTFPFHNHYLGPCLSIHEKNKFEYYLRYSNVEIYMKFKNNHQLEDYKLAYIVDDNQWIKNTTINENVHQNFKKNLETGESLDSISLFTQKINIIKQGEFCPQHIIEGYEKEVTSLINEIIPHITAENKDNKENLIKLLTSYANLRRHQLKSLKDYLIINKFLNESFNYIDEVKKIDPDAFKKNMHFQNSYFSLKYSHLYRSIKNKTEFRKIFVSIHKGFLDLFKTQKNEFDSLLISPRLIEILLSTYICVSDYKIIRDSELRDFLSILLKLLFKEISIIDKKNGSPSTDLFDRIILKNHKRGWYFITNEIIVQKIMTLANKQINRINPNNLDVINYLITFALKYVYDYLQLQENGLKHNIKQFLASIEKYIDERVDEKAQEIRALIEDNKHFLEFQSKNEISHMEDILGFQEQFKVVAFDKNGEVYSTFSQKQYFVSYLCILKQVDEYFGVKINRSEFIQLCIELVLSGKKIIPNISLTQKTSFKQIAYLSDFFNEKFQRVCGKSTMNHLIQLSYLNLKSWVITEHKTLYSLYTVSSNTYVRRKIGSNIKEISFYNGDNQSWGMNQMMGKYAQYLDNQNMEKFETFLMNALFEGDIQFDQEQYLIQYELTPEEKQLWHMDKIFFTLGMLIDDYYIVDSYSIKGGNEIIKSIDTARAA